MFVIYDKTHVTIEDSFSTERGAKISFTRKGYDPEKFGITTSRDFYDNVDKDVEVKNLMTGQPIKIRQSQRGSACDPSTERNNVAIVSLHQMDEESRH